VYDFDAVRYPCPDDRITLPCLTVRTQHEVSSVDKHIERKRNNLEDFHSNSMILDLLFLQGSYFSMLFILTFRKNGKKGNNNPYNVQRL